LLVVRKSLDGTLYLVKSHVLIVLQHARSSFFQPCL
jgi:hypothetical protein